MMEETVEPYDSDPARGCGVSKETIGGDKGTGFLGHRDTDPDLR